MRVGLLGIGAVGEACAHLLVSSGAARQLVLGNRSVEIANAVRQDLEQSRSWGTPLAAPATTPWDTARFTGCDLLILAAGPRLRGDQSRADKAKETASLLIGTPGASIVESLQQHARSTQPQPILLVVTNPVEATVTWLARRTEWDRRRIIGLGATVETARFSGFVADRLNVDAISVWTEIIGEHGPNIEVRDVPALIARAKQLAPYAPLVDKDVAALLKRTRSAAAKIRKVSEHAGRVRAQRFLKALRDKGVTLDAGQIAVLEADLAAELSPPATRFAIAASVLEVVQAIAMDRARVLTVSGFTVPQQTPDVALALPFVVARSGLLDLRYDLPSATLTEALKSIAEQVSAMDS